MKGTLCDFLELVEHEPELARKLGELAAEYGFEFVDEGWSDADLDAVCGGVDWMTPQEADSLRLQALQSEHASEMVHLSKHAHDSVMAILRSRG